MIIHDNSVEQPASHMTSNRLKHQISSFFVHPLKGKSVGPRIKMVWDGESTVSFNCPKPLPQRITPCAKGIIPTETGN